MSTARKVFDAAFHAGREPRSAAYKAGVLHYLRVRLDGAAKEPCLYPAGSAESDAYYAGIDEGRALAPTGGVPGTGSAS